MQYIRTLREQPGYNPATSHLITGNDADLICLGLATHETNISILRNTLGDNFASDPNSYCVFSINKFRHRLAMDFGPSVSDDFEAVVDDFIYLCFLIGNDFLPNVPLINIKSKGLETILDHYVRAHHQFGFLTENGNIHFARVQHYLSSLVEQRLSDFIALSREKSTRISRAKTRLNERLREISTEIDATLKELEEKPGQELSNKLVKLKANLIKEQEAFVVDKEAPSFQYGEENYRTKYYMSKFEWDLDLKTKEGRALLEDNIRCVCEDYHRGMQWVLLYYTVGCPSWSWYYPYYYAPLLQDLALHCDRINIEMDLGKPLKPVEQLVAVLPRESVRILPEELHDAVNDHTSVLARFYPQSFKIDLREAIFAHQGVAHLPFINVRKLKKVMQSILSAEDMDQSLGETVLYAKISTRVGSTLSHLILDSQQRLSKSNKHSQSSIVLSEYFTMNVLPLGGRVRSYFKAYPINIHVKCPDQGLVKRKQILTTGILDKPLQSSVEVPEVLIEATQPIKTNQVFSCVYEWSNTAMYKQYLLPGAELAVHPRIPMLHQLLKQPENGYEYQNYSNVKRGKYERS